MKDLLRLLGLFKPYLGWMMLGVLLSLITVLANVGLMAMSGWFISAMALAGAAGVSMNCFRTSRLDSCRCYEPYSRSVMPSV